MDAEERPLDERALARRRARGDEPVADAGTRHAASPQNDDARRDQRRESARRWREENRERARVHNRESMRRTLAARRERDARRAQGRAWYHEHRDQERERHRRFRAEHPEKVRGYQERYRAKHPERAAEQSRAGTTRWRDRNADIVRETNRLAARERRRADPDLERRKYQEDIEAQRARSRENARRRRRLEVLGLPARRIHVVYAAQKRANQAAADAFFATRRTARQIRDLHLEKDRAPYTRLAKADARRTAIGAAPSPLELELNAARDIDAELALWKRLLPAIVTRFTERHRDRIREEIRMDSIARQLAGKPAYDVAAELARRVRAEAFQDAAKHLVPDGDRARLQRLYGVMFPRQEARRANQTAPVRNPRVVAEFPRNAGMSR